MGSYWNYDMYESRNYAYYHWVLKEAPAIREEPFITTVSDYRNRVEFQLAEYKNRWGFYDSFVKSWDDLAEELMGMRSFGRQLSSSRSLRRLVDELTDSLEGEYEIANELYSFVAEQIRWNDKYRFIPEDGVSTALDEKIGDSAEKALLLVNMLRIADLDAYPVLVSTRDYGKVEWYYPRISQFNHILVKVTIDQTIYLLDPLHEFIPFGIIHPASVNEGGLVIQEEGANILEITSLIGSSNGSIAVIQLDAQGDLSGTIVSRLNGYSAILNRVILSDMETEEYIQQHLLTQ